MIVEIRKQGQPTQFLDAECVAFEGQTLTVNVKSPTSSATTVPAGTGTIAGEPDPRTVKCPVCPHSASMHTDSGCIQQHVTDKAFRSPGVTGVCNCSKTYKQAMEGITILSF
jgi:hypothetical protein